MFKVALQNFVLIFIINFIVVVHELGHYVFAKMFGVHVRMFCIGVGSPLFNFTDRNGTMWVFCIFPFGSYVSLLESDNGIEKGASSLHPLKSFLIAFAGPIFNFVLFALIYFGIFYNINYQVDLYEALLSVEENVFLNERLLKHNSQNFQITIKECSSLIFNKFYKNISHIFNSQLIGPIGIFKNLKIHSKNGVLSMFYAIANLSLSLGICQLIPLYVLDGGMMLSNLYVYCFNASISERTSLVLTYLSIILIVSLLGVTMLYEILDLWRFVW